MLPGRARSEPTVGWAQPEDASHHFLYQKHVSTLAGWSRGDSLCRHSWPQPQEECIWMVNWYTFFAWILRTSLDPFFHVFSPLTLNNSFFSMVLTLGRFRSLCMATVKATVSGKRSFRVCSVVPPIVSASMTAASRSKKAKNPPPGWWPTESWEWSTPIPWKRPFAGQTLDPWGNNILPPDIWRRWATWFVMPFWTSVILIRARPVSLVDQCGNHSYIYGIWCGLAIPNPLWLKKHFG